MERAIRVAKVMILEAAISLADLCLFALVLMKVQPEESTIRTGIKFVYVVTNLVGGFLIGKVMHQRKFLWGVLTGVMYFAVVSVVSFIVHQGFYQDVQNAVVTCLLCIVGGMIGGMIS